MSCEGNRHKFFSWLQNARGLDAAMLEKRYQSAKSAGGSPELLPVAQMKTRRLFQAMQAVGIKPPTHSPSGLPKDASCFGYAAVMDYLEGQEVSLLQSAFFTPQSLGISENEWQNLAFRIANAPSYTGVNPLSGLSKNGTNLQGWNAWKRNRGGIHAWLGEKDSYEAVTGVPENVSSPIDTVDEHLFWGRESSGDTGDYMAFLADWRPDADGIYPDGYHESGFNRQGYTDTGLSIYGFRKGQIPDSVGDFVSGTTVIVHRARANRKTRKEYHVDIEGFCPKDGFFPGATLYEQDDRDRFGWNRLGFRNGRSWTGYDENGLDSQGNPFPKRTWFDAWGYDRRDGLTAPDDQGRRYNLIGWVYDPQTGKCYNPQNPSQKMQHEGSWKYSRKAKKVILLRSYTPSTGELEARVRDPSIRMNEILQGSPYLPFPASDGYGHSVQIGKTRALHDAQDAANSDLRSEFIHAQPYMRYLRSKERADRNPQAAYFGVRLRCSHCGQFTGAVAHICPAKDKRKILDFSSGFVVGIEKSDAPVPQGTMDVLDDLTDQYQARYSPSALRTREVERATTNSGLDPAVAPWNPRYPQIGFDFLASASRQPGEVAIVLETPLREDFNPEYEGGPVPGYSWRTGLDPEGYTWQGYHYLTGLDRDGRSIRDQVRAQVAKDKLQSMLQSGLSPNNEEDVSALEKLFSRVASAMAGTSRRVKLTTQGEQGQFWTDMKGRIQGERYPLGKAAEDAYNLICCKAGLYHELGHEEDTDPGVWARVLQVAKGEEQVPGLPPDQAGIVAELFNILEDGRMERSQARKRRGVAAFLSADARLKPRWDEVVGDDIPIPHQVLGMMLYRSLPFFQVKPDVYRRAHPDARHLFDQVRPLVDRAVTGRASDAFQSSIEIARILTQNADMQSLAKKMTAQPAMRDGRWVEADGQGGGTLIISSTPDVQGAQPDMSIAIPSPGSSAENQPHGQQPGSGRQAQRKQDKMQPGSGHRQGKQDETQAKPGRQMQTTQDDEQSGNGGRHQEAQRDGDGSGGTEDRSATVPPEPGGDFFSAVADNTDITAIIDSLAGDIATEVKGRKARHARRGPLGTALQSPQGVRFWVRSRRAGSEDYIHDTLSVPGSDRLISINIRRGVPDRGGISRSQWPDDLYRQSKKAGKDLARRLRGLKDEARKKARYQTHGSMDRKRFKRAVAGSESVRSRTRREDITSLAVSLQLDVSGSMSSHVYTGELFAATTAFATAMEDLEAEYMVSAFGTQTTILKTLGDQTIPDEHLGYLLSADLGGTLGTAGMVAGLEGLKGASSANKLHIVMTDGELADQELSAKVTDKMRKSGILPFGVYFGDDPPKEQMDDVFGPGGWVNIRTLDELPKVVAGRIERIYRKILARR